MKNKKLLNPPAFFEEALSSVEDEDTLWLAGMVYTFGGKCPLTGISSDKNGRRNFSLKAAFKTKDGAMSARATLMALAVAKSTSILSALRLDQTKVFSIRPTHDAPFKVSRMEQVEIARGLGARFIVMDVPCGTIIEDYDFTSKTGV